MDHHRGSGEGGGRGSGGGGRQHNTSGGGGGSGGGRGSSSRKNKAAAAAAAAVADQHQRNNLLMEAAALSSSSRNQQQQLAELFAAHQHHQQQQQLAHHLAALTSSAAASSTSTSTNSSAGGSNPLSLLQQQMNAIMQQTPPTSSASGTNSPFNNPAAAWWYLEYLSRIQAAQIIPNLDLAQASQQQTQQQQQHPEPNSNERGGRGSGSGSGSKGSSKKAQQQQQLQQQLQQQQQQALLSLQAQAQQQQQPLLPPPPPSGHGKRPGKRKQAEAAQSSGIMNLNLNNSIISNNSITISPIITPSSALPPSISSNHHGGVSDPLNLSGKSPRLGGGGGHPMKIPKIMTSPALSITPPSSAITATPLQPPAAHSTPINLSTPPGKYSSATKEPLPAHINNKPIAYTHMIPKFPQIGLIGSSPPKMPKLGNEKQSKKKTVASLLAQTRGGTPTPPPASTTPSEISYRPWLVNEQHPLPHQQEPQKLIIPSVKKELPDYNLALKMGWKRDTLIKNLDDLIDSSLEGVGHPAIVTYTTPTGVKCKSLTEIKKQLNQRTAELTPKHFSFNSSLFIGTVILNFEGEIIRITGPELKPMLKDAGLLIAKLAMMKAEQEKGREDARIRLLQEQREKEDKERKKQHSLLIKSLEIHKKNKRRLKLQAERKLKKKLVEAELFEKPEVKEDLDELDEKDSELKELPNLETCLSPQAFSRLLQIYEFLNTFGETLGFDMESLPNLESLLKGFINHPENEEELQSILIHLIVCAVEDPGMPNPTKHLTPFNQTLKQADVTFGSLSEILRIYLEGISDSEPEAETYSNWLNEAPFTAHNPGRKTSIVSFLCDILLQNKAVLKHLEQSSELIHNCKKERQQNDIKIRKLRMLCARKAVALACEEDDENGKNVDGSVVKIETEKSEGVKIESPNGKSDSGVGEDDSTIATNTTTTVKNETAVVIKNEVIVVKKEKEDSVAVKGPPPSPPPAQNNTQETAGLLDSDPEEPSDADAKLSIDEIRSKMTQLQNVNEKLKKQMQVNIKNIRSCCLGQDRFRRRYWNLPHSGGVFVEGGRSAEFEDLQEKVKERFEKGDLEESRRINDCKSAAKIIVDNVIVSPPPEPAVELPLIPVQDENTPPPINNNISANNNINTPPNSTPNANNTVANSMNHSPLVNNGVFEVPPPCIKIFSFLKENLCSGKAPVVQDEVKEVGPTDDELLVANITPEKWNHYYAIRCDNDAVDFAETLMEKGVRERGLKNAFGNLNITRPVPEFEDTETCEEIGEDVGVDPDLVYKIHQGLIETLETLEERVASASLQMKGWTLPMPRNLQHTGLKQEEIVEIVKVRLLDLEQAVERRYLKPPLGKSANELNLSNLVGEDNANALNTNEISNGPPCGSTSSTRGQQIQENNKLKEQKEKEERMQAANESKNSCSRFLTHWRDAIAKSCSPSVLSMAIYLLDSSIAWDKSVMKASCQLCKGGDNEDKLLLCDACDRGYHTYCFKPPLEQIPEGDWFCWECINKATGNRGCIVCGKGNLTGKKLLACDKCVKAYHTDCISPAVTKVPRGRWYCPDHQVSSAASKGHHHHSHHHQQTSPSKKKASLTPSSNAATPKAATVVPVAEPVVPPPTPATTPVTPSTPIVEMIPSPVKKSNGGGGSNSGGSTPNSTSGVPNKKMKQELAWCERILDDLASHEDAWPFLEPVNTRQFPTYKKVIKTPMDLQTIRKTMQSGVYKSREQFLQDVRLIFDNCETFNEDDSPVGKAGHSLRVFFESKTFTGGSCDSSNA